MKVGIVTFIQTTNFGASLQAYALQESVAAMGNQAEIVRYVNRAVEEREKNTGRLSARTLSKKIVMRGGIQRKKDGFRAFEDKRFRYGKELTDSNPDAVAEEYDAFLAGSDQIWNTRLTNADWTYFLDFTEEKRKKISYAASFGDKEVLPFYREKISDLLKRFGQLSLREQSGADVVAELTGRNAAVTLDPTLLLNKAQWEERVAFKPDHAPYILVYFPHNQKVVFDFVKRLQKKTGLPVVYLSISPRPQPGVETIYDASPEEFVGWIRHAEYVVTGSFHGTAFSVNLEKQFFCEPQKAGSRIDNLLGVCGLTDRVIDSEGVLERTIDYTVPRQQLQAAREQSLTWLRDALNRANDASAWEQPVTVPVSKEQCCGCSGCVSVCPTGAIAMQRDERGFAYPAVDADKCVRCGRCLKTCAFFNHRKTEGTIDMVTVARHRDSEVRMNSQSGGMFVAVSDWILEQGGTVYGCVLDEHFHAVHIRAADKETRDRMCGSKYVQSDTSGIFEDIRRDLENGLPVMLSGTACQTDGIQKALQAKKVNTDRLYVVDIICHGVPSPLIFEEYIGYLNRKYGTAPTDFNFRDKRATGWDGHRESFRINGKKYITYTYKQIFYGGGCLRPSCFHCRYAEIDRQSDITIADAWGIKRKKPEIYDNRGHSVVLVHSEKGQELLKQVKLACETIEMPLQMLMQRNLYAPTKPDRDPERFWHCYRKKGFDGVVASYGTLSTPKKLKVTGKQQLRKLLLSRKYYLGEKEVNQS